jgi:hypothetical protein
VLLIFGFGFLILLALFLIEKMERAFMNSVLIKMLSLETECIVKLNKTKSRKHAIQICFNDLCTYILITIHLLLLHSTTLCCCLMLHRIYFYAQIPARGNLNSYIPFHLYIMLLPFLLETGVEWGKNIEVNNVSTK